LYHLCRLQDKAHVTETGVLAVRYPLEIKELLIAAAPDIFFDAVFSFPSEQQTRRCCFLDNLCFLPQTDARVKPHLRLSADHTTVVPAISALRKPG
jgi:hypothetical protein